MSQQQLSTVLWVAIFSLGIFGIFHLFIGFGNPPQLIASAINFVLIFGLIRLSRWAYFLSIIVAITGPVLLIIQGTAYALFILILNATVLIPVLLCTKDFFPKNVKEKVAV